MTTNLTKSEFDVMNNIAHHEMNSINGATPESADEVNTWCWIEDFAGDLTVNQTKGVLSSLVKKEFVIIFPDGAETTIDFTKTGFDVWKKEFENQNLSIAS